ncbi:PREDICTED: leucine-rich repeat extensin-like protein 2 [Ipomoea nil]|uniref:leucine-rich repeat extensin-like protein 2 n=1 Tax=Ipomoea nil TaxID=35883 RepID=UPI000901ABCB|nr:PREDICTED: leucine-rich repeat extensin-like protein 2 [Ipomoea nil]
MVTKRGIEPNPEKVQAIMDMQPPSTVKDLQCKMVSNESQENEMRKSTKRTWEKVLKQPRRATQTDTRRNEGETPSNPLILISEEKEQEKESLQIQAVAESPPREPGFIYEEDNGDKKQSVKQEKVEGSEPPFMKFSPVVQPDMYAEILYMSNSEYLIYLKQLTFGPVLPPPSFDFDGLYQPPPPPEPLPKFPPSPPVLAPLPQEVPAPSPPPQQMPLNPFIRPPVDFTRFFNQTYSSSSSNGSMFEESESSGDSGPGYAPSPPGGYDSEDCMSTGFSAC